MEFFEFDEAYLAKVSRRRKKKLQYRQGLLTPDIELDFEGETGLVENLGIVSFLGGISVLTGSVPGQTTQQPGALKLKEVTGKTKLGFWSGLPKEVRWENSVNLKTINLISGNFDNFKIGLECQDAVGNNLGNVVVVSSTGNFVPIELDIQNVSRLIISRDITSSEVRSPNAVGTILIVGGRPRPPVYTKSVFLSSITYR